jgi:hypothetical protein
MSPPTERIKSAYIGLCLFAFLVVLRLGPLQQNDQGQDQDPGYYVANLAREAMSGSDLRLYESCAVGKSPQEFSHLTVALVAVENLARPRWQRRLELLFARVFLFLTGRLPNLSLGIGQLRVSTAKKLIAANGVTIRDHELLQLLSDDCSCIKLAYQYVVSLSTSEGCQRKGGALQDDDTPNWGCGHLIVRAYNGQSANGNLGRGLWRDLYESMTFYNFNDLRTRQR